MNMNTIEQLEAELTSNDPYGALQDRLVQNDDNMLEELVAMRKRKGLSQDVVASRMNRSKTAVSNFERLGADPHLSTIRRYAAAVGAQITTRVHDFDLIGQLFEGATLVRVEVSHRRAHQGACRAVELADIALEPWATV
jgi:transcriptional regulator with XRE-family HTH domain